MERVTEMRSPPREVMEVIKSRKDRLEEICRGRPTEEAPGSSSLVQSLYSAEITRWQMSENGLKGVLGAQVLNKFMRLSRSYQKRLSQHSVAIFLMQAIVYGLSICAWIFMLAAGKAATAAAAVGALVERFDNEPFSGFSAK